MATAFQPKDKVAQWRKVFPLLEGLDFGDTVTYEQLFDVLGLEPSKENRVYVRAPLDRAAKEWGAEHKRALQNVANVGYRVIQPEEHGDKSKSFRRKSRRSLQRSLKALQDADRSKLTLLKATEFDRLQITVARHGEMLRQIDSRQSKVERTLEEDRSKNEEDRAKNDERLARMEDILRRHGIV